MISTQSTIPPYRQSYNSSQISTNSKFMNWLSVKQKKCHSRICW